MTLPLELAQDATSLLTVLVGRDRAFVAQFVDARQTLARRSCTVWVSSVGSPSTRVPAKRAVKARTQPAISGSDPVTEKMTDTAAMAVARSFVS